MQADYDLCIIGGGINGTGIAREAAGRGLSVLLVEAQDLAQGTSSASTKLIHGGLRYLEMGEFRLVRESLIEREILLRTAPHIVHPLEFVMPWVPHLRPKWMIAFGLWLYDHIGGRRSLAKSMSFSLRDSLTGQPLAATYHDAFKYADCKVDDSRLVILNAMDAKKRGAEILTRTACLRMTRASDVNAWHVRLRDLRSGDEFQVSARMIVNAGGPWVRGILDASGLSRYETPNVRLVKGSHIVVPQLYDGAHAYLLQQPDKRVVFAIPYQNDHTLIGTTDEPFTGDAFKPAISNAERAYLCDAANRFFTAQITPADIGWTYSGVRALFDSGEGEARKVTRDFRLDLDSLNNLPILSVFGGKLTTYRALAQKAVDKITKNRKNSGWTAKAPLPGGDIPNVDFPAFVASQTARYKFLPDGLAARYARAYGTLMDVMLKNCQTMRALGRDFGGDLYEVEVLYLIDHEFAKTAEDILWRRSKLGLTTEKKTILGLQAAMPDYLKQRQAA